MKKGDTYSHQFLINEIIYEGFKVLFKDFNPLHTDRIFAKAKGFESEVMHGNILGGFLSYFVGESLPLKNVIIHSQEIKYIKPIYLHDELNFYAQIEDVFDSVKVIEFSFVFKNQNEQKVAKGKITIGLI